ncbi:MAG: RagB/SusD family nutrient uptake outer membrane protein [Bacteroidales bacterium]|nr:RagB/SusD family nutrient uptake outer membrane protein [Bacteroidales bacterium]
MKKITYIIAIMIASAIGITSCTDDALEVENTNQLALSSFYKTPEDAFYAMNACYTPLAHSGVFGLRWFFLFGSFEDRTLFETAAMDNISINSSNEFVTWMHRDLYMGVWRTSHVLYNLQELEIEGLEEGTREQYMAQIRALRSMYYFLLVTIFDRPIFFDETSLPVDAYEAYPNGERIRFWNKIVEDLEYAIGILPESYPDNDVGRITSGAAKALLGKAMLYKYYYYHLRMGSGQAEINTDLELAKTMLKEVMESPAYALILPKADERVDYINAVLCNTSYMDLPASDGSFYPSENNSESVWEVQYTDKRINEGWLPGWQWSGNMNFQWFYHHESSFKNHEAHPDMYYAFEEVTGHPAGFVKDPRTFASLYLDGDRLHFVPEEEYYSKFYTSGLNNKRVASGRGLSRPGQPSIGFGPKKYAYPTYNDLAAPNNAPFNHRIIRLADVYLLYAETSLLLDNDADGSGLSALNEVRDRVKMPPVAALTTDAIIHERDVELAFEGHRYIDLIRWSFDPQWAIDWNEIYDGDVFQVGKNEFLPIPLSEINVNRGLLKQNPGW